MPARGGLRADDARAEGVEENLEGGEEELAEDVVEQEKLGPGGEVRVDAIFALVFVVLDMIALGS
jgi:hypothetical protein